VELRELIVMRTASDELVFDRRTYRLISFRRLAVPDQEFIAAREDDPAFELQYLDGDRRYGWLRSSQAASLSLDEITGEDGLTARFTVVFRRLNGLDVDVTVSVRAEPGDDFSRWSLAVRNGEGLRIVDVQFPFVVAPYRLGGAAGSEALVWPFGPGMLVRAPQPQDLSPDCPHTWQFRPENGDIGHYPGYTFAQFLAYYNDRAGLFLACQDAAGHVKNLKPVHREPALRLGVSHAGDWPARGERRLEYDVVLGSFAGDWHAAAELYRRWSLEQPWAARPLSARADVPDWLLDSPPHIIVRIQGQLDIGPATPNEAFLPYARITPMLDALSAKLDAPVLPVIMSWEQPGPWIYPDCFPPAGGARSLAEFTLQMRQRGWHVGTFCNGTRWVTGHFWSGYDGTDRFVEQGGPATVCRTSDGQMWQESWDATWRPSYAGCLGVPKTREMALNFVRTVIDLGLDWIQFFDQNVGCCAFPCFADDHGHPDVPGAWMNAAMRETVDGFHAIAAEQAGRPIAFSVEGLVNETNLGDFAICDVRVVPPGHTPSNWIPLYHFLYHEFILIQGGFGSAPEPHHLPIRNAYNWVIGEIPGAVLKGDGRLLNNDTFNWAPWEPHIGDEDQSVAMLRAATALRRGAARDYLVFGRMQAPAAVDGIREMRWQHGGRDHRIPAVFHAAWSAPGGRFAVALANWTSEPQAVSLREARLGGQAALTVSAQSIESRSLAVQSGQVELVLPALSCALVEGALPA
jgi:hypothetical protein